MKRSEIAEWLVDRVEKLESFPSYDEAMVIVREMEQLEECWYGWLVERKRVELVAKVYRMLNE
tara:strand:- start:32393 stop:32581 length:189 start_codon:yes stop_codon:yes gene_type:complete